MKKNLLLLFSLLFGLGLVHVQAQEEVELKTMADARAAGVGAIVKVKGVVTTGNTIDGRLRYFQDSTAGLVVFYSNLTGADSKGFDLSTAEIGDTIQVTGQLDEFNGLLQVVFSVDGNEVPQANAELVYDRSEATNPTPLPKPITVTAANLADSLEGRLIRFANAQILTTSRTFARGNYTMIDSTGSEDNEFQMRINNDANSLIGTDIPTGLVDIVGVLGEFRGTYQILPRDEEDLVAGLSIEEFTQITQNTTSLSVSFTTTLRAGGLLRYKRYDRPDSEYDTVFLADSQNSFTAELRNLEPAQFYNIEVYTTASGDATKSVSLENIIVATKSTSSGSIRVLFNYLPNDLPADIMYMPENYSSDFAADIASIIDRAQQSVDVAIYNVNGGGTAILNAINRAYERGLQVRYLYQSDDFNYEIDQWNSNVSKRARPEGDGIMHNKFVVVDAASAQNSYVVTGSSNWTNNNLFDESNDLLIIQDQALARAYTVEFNEMWGSPTVSTTANQLRFGADKTMNTPFLFNIGGRKVQLYFSPSGGVNSRILDAITDTRSDIRFALTDITRSDLATALIDEAARGWSVKGIIQADDLTIENDTLNSGDNSEAVMQQFYAARTTPGLEVVFDTVTHLHHKFVVANALRSEASPFVLTGSHNWSNAAEEDNDENTLVIYDQQIAEAYLNHWRILYYEATEGKRDDVLTNIEADSYSGIKVYPNPTEGQLNVRSTSGKPLRYTLLNVQGKAVYSGTLAPSSQAQPIHLTNLEAGIYYLQLTTGKTLTTQKIILTR
jgi:phosphatidylserine/phosphatidylglycerophosphate/cardiolipin synthase-like enzyme